jgi:hypothetical protein
MSGGPGEGRSCHSSHGYRHPTRSDRLSNDSYELDNINPTSTPRKPLFRTTFDATPTVQRSNSDFPHDHGNAL